MRTFVRRLKGAAVNAAFWGITWFGAGFVALGGATAFGTIKLAQRGSRLESLEEGSDRLLMEPTN